MPSPRYQMRMSFSRWPRVAATPAATASASLRTSTGTCRPPLASTAVKATANAKPFTCCWLGDSSTTPLRITPGKPTPTQSIFPPLADSRTCCPIRSTISSAVMACGSWCWPGSGKSRTGPLNTLSSTTPIAICRVASTPIVCPIVDISTLQTRQFVQAVERGGLITLGQRRIVENGIHKVIHGPLQDHDRLADMQQLGCPFSDDVDAEDFPGLAMKDQLQAAGSVAADLAARDLAIVSHAHLVGRIFLGQLLFGLTDKRNLRDGVNAVRIGC